MARRKIDKQALASLVRESKELSNDQKADLLQLLNEQKRYGLVWEQHKEDAEELLEENIPVLVEDDSKRILSPSPEGEGWGGAPNHILIEGDNLHALTALTYTHEGKVDVIYIDPPYNTGNKDFVYNDKFVDSEDGYRHSKWLSFMEKRLRIAKKLLSDRGVIFISIDDNEQANLKLLCDEVFGGDCFAGDIAWQRTYSPRNDSKGISNEKEHILVYSRGSEWVPNKLPRTSEMDSKYKNPDNDDTPWTSSDCFGPGASSHQGMVYAIQHPFTGNMIYPYTGAHWTLKQEAILEIMSGWGEYELKDLNDESIRADICGINVSDVKSGVMGIVLKQPVEIACEHAQHVYNRGKWPKFYFTNKGKGGIRRKTYLNKTDGQVPTNLWMYDSVGHTDEAKKEITNIFNGKKPFETPKPTRLIKRVIHVGGGKNSLILDFFAGSGTTLHATMQLNAEDGGHRQCILVTNNENNICEEVTYERNKRVINGYTTPKGVEVPGLTNNNLRYYKTAFVPREKTAANRHALMNMSTDLLCIKENMYNEQPFEIEGKKMKPEFVRYFVSDSQDMIIIYDPRAVSFVAKALPQDSKKKIMVYVYSDGQYAYNDEFHGKNIELCALPDAIYQALSRVLPPMKEVEMNIEQEGTL